MSDIKQIVAKNILALRTKNHITQLELGEKLNYSDKAISKWERGESIPDVTVLKAIGEIFGVSVDYLLYEHDENEKKQETYQADIIDIEINHKVIAMIAIVGIWTLALLVYLILWWTTKLSVWSVFLYTVPLSLIVLLVFNCIWSKRKIFNFWIISGLVWSILIVVCVCIRVFADFSIWQLLSLGVPAEILIALSFMIRKKRTK